MSDMQNGQQWPQYGSMPGFSVAELERLLTSSAPELQTLRKLIPLEMAAVMQRVASMVPQMRQGQGMAQSFNAFGNQLQQYGGQNAFPPQVYGWFA